MWIEFFVPLLNGNRVYNLKEKSRYNDNFYELEPSIFGDCFNLHGNHIMREEYSEIGNCYDYSFGKFVNEKFEPVITFETRECLSYFAVDKSEED